MVSRSKPIAIQHAHHLAIEDDEEEEQREKSFYESRTWKMYNRIVDHRLNTPPKPASPIHDACNGWQSPQFASPVGSPTTRLVRPQPRYARAGAPVIPSFDLFYEKEPAFDNQGLEDEVFDFEL